MAFIKHNFQTAEEVMAVIDDLETEEAIDAVVIPPEVDSLTDEEETEDSRMILNDLGEALPGDVVGTFEIHTISEGRFDTTEPETSSQEENNQRPNPKKPKQTQERTARWCKCVPKYINTPKNCEVQRVKEIQNKFGSFTPIQMFELFLDKTVLDEIVEFTVKYARSKNNKVFHMRRADLKKFIGILIFSGYHSLPQTKFYWSLDEDKGVPLIRETMPRNRFDEIKKYIYLSDDDNLDKFDKYSKIRRFFNNLNRRFLQFGVFSHEVSIDEQIVPYFGHHSAKMFIKGKSVRFGFKQWCLASACGYMYQFEPYGEASQNTDGNMDLVERVVTNLLKVVPDPENHVVFFDDFFTSHDLLTLLSEMKFFAAGTVTENRMASCPLPTVSNFKNKPKGSYDFRLDKKNNIFAVRWRDNSVVTILTNFGTIKPTIPVRRYSFKEKKYNTVPHPNVVHRYNQGMGGVDLHDNVIANYRIRVRGKKWWWPLFTNGIDSAIVNAWKMYQIATGCDMSQIDFRSQIVLSLLKGEEETELEGKKVKSKNINLKNSNKNSLPVGDDRIDHLIIRSEENARRRCRICKSQTIYLCKKCQVHLHTECFSKFHE